MASSFSEQIPLIVHVLQQCRPQTVLDIGKGFGKYGFLLHEYVGIDPFRRPTPSKTLAQQSGITIDAVECNPNYLWPHLDHLYRNIFLGRIEELYGNLPQYDLVLMCDVIEHLDKSKAVPILQHFLARHSKILVSTPKNFFRQECYESEAEHHVSYWSKRDLKINGNFVDYQTIGAGRVFLLSNERTDIRGFGQGIRKSCRRLARCVINEIDH